MSFAALKAHEKKVAEARAQEAEDEKRRDLRRAVRDVIPRSVRVPKRGKGRSPNGGVSKKEVAALRARAEAFLDGEAGMNALQAEVQRTALVILLIDGVLGTEPWRASGGPHGGIIAANARLRYLENASRLLMDIRQRNGSGDSSTKLLEGVIDAEVVK